MYLMATRSLATMTANPSISRWLSPTSTEHSPAGVRPLPPPPPRRSHCLAPTCTRVRRVPLLTIAHSHSLPMPRSIGISRQVRCTLRGRCRRIRTRQRTAADAAAESLVCIDILRSVRRQSGTSRAIGPQTTPSNYLPFVARSSHPYCHMAARAQLQGVYVSRPKLHFWD